MKTYQVRVPTVFWRYMDNYTVYALYLRGQLAQLKAESSWREQCEEALARHLREPRLRSGYVDPRVLRTTLAARFVEDAGVVADTGLHQVKLSHAFWKRMSAY